MRGAATMKCASTGRRQFLGSMVLAWAAIGPAGAQPVTIDTKSEGEIITVTASADLIVAPGTVWNAISDYDHLADFIPDMRSSRVLRRDGNKVLVAQSGHFGFLFFRQPVEVKLEVLETPQRRIVARAVGGNLREMEGRYVVDALPSGAVRLSYSGRLVPDFPVPPIVGKLVVRNILSRQFSALVKEIIRRDAATR